MAEAILSLSPDNGWSSKLTLVDRRRAHWILQVVGSLLAIVGSIIKFLDKNTHWTTYHGQFGKYSRHKMVFSSYQVNYKPDFNYYFDSVSVRLNVHICGI